MIALLIIIVSVISSLLTRFVLSQLGDFREGFESEGTVRLQKIMSAVDIVSVKQQGDNPGDYYKPKMVRAIRIKNLSAPSLTVTNMPYNRAGFRWCAKEPCSDSAQWGLEFSNANDLLYRSHTNGHMPTREESERKRLIYPGWNWFARVFSTPSPINFPPISRH